MIVTATVPCLAVALLAAYRIVEASSAVASVVASVAAAVAAAVAAYASISALILVAVFASWPVAWVVLESEAVGVAGWALLVVVAADQAAVNSWLAAPW